MIADVVDPIGRTLSTRSVIGYSHNTTHNVVDVSEIAAHVTIVEYADGFARKNRLHKQESEHIRPSPGTVHGEESQTRCRNRVQMAVGMRHQLAGFFRS